MRLVEVMDRDAAMLAIRDDLVHLADRIRLLRHQRSIKQVTASRTATGTSAGECCAAGTAHSA